MTPQEVLQCVCELRPNNTFYFDGDCTIDNIVWDSDGVTLPTTSEIEEHWRGVSRIKSMKELRQERNRRLAEVDWIFSEDYAIDDASYQQWLTYRKALRDLPAVTEDPANPVWPEKPAMPSGTTETKDYTRELQNENNRLKNKVAILENRQTHFNTLLVNLTGRIETLERGA
uniref:Phage tail assembly chaperone-like domain-containing protein n=1 Tax=Micromonas commoda virus TaxID=3057169 RepID=A0AAU7YQP4_9PHYC